MKNYEMRVTKILLKAQDEILRILNERGLEEVLFNSTSGWVFCATDETGDNYEMRPIKGVKIARWKDGNGTEREALDMIYDPAPVAFTDRSIWLELYNDTCRHFGIE